MWTYWALAFLCVVGISVGQVLFKSAATSFEAAQSIFVLRPMLVLFAALVLYAVTTVGWVFVLSKLSLAKAYPLMALAFIFVPFLSVFVFNELIGLRYTIQPASFSLFSVLLYQLPPDSGESLYPLVEMQCFFVRLCKPDVLLLL